MGLRTCSAADLAQTWRGCPTVRPIDREGRVITPAAGLVSHSSPVPPLPLPLSRHNTSLARATGGRIGVIALANGRYAGPPPHPPRPSPRPLHASRTHAACCMAVGAHSHAAARLAGPSGAVAKAIAALAAELEPRGCREQEAAADIGDVNSSARLRAVAARPHPDVEVALTQHLRSTHASGHDERQWFTAASTLVLEVVLPQVFASCVFVCGTTN